jgi:hypothetical protein
MGLKVSIFGLYTKANKVNCGLEEQIQVVYIGLMGILSKENIR